MPQRRAIPESILSAFNPGTAIGAKLAVRKNATDGDQVALPAASTDGLFGVTVNPIGASKWGDVQTRGVAIVISGAAVAAGATLMSNTAGKAITFVAAAGNAILGQAKNAAAGADEEIEVILSGPMNFGAT